MIRRLRMSIILLIFTSSIHGCAMSSRKILTAEYVSMTAETPPSKAIQKGGPISSKWCLKDKKVIAQKNEVGMIDQVVMKAQEEHKTDYILHPSFTWVPGGLFSAPCMVMHGFQPQGK